MGNEQCTPIFKLLCWGLDIFPLLCYCLRLNLHEDPYSYMYTRNIYNDPLIIKERGIRKILARYSKGS